MNSRSAGTPFAQGTAVSVLKGYPIKLNSDDADRPLVGASSGAFNRSTTREGPQPTFQQDAETGFGGRQRLIVLSPNRILISPAIATSQTRPAGFEYGGQSYRLRGRRMSARLQGITANSRARFRGEPRSGNPEPFYRFPLVRRSRLCEHRRSGPIARRHAKPKRFAVRSPGPPCQAIVLPFRSFGRGRSVTPKGDPHCERPSNQGISGRRWLTLRVGGSCLSGRADQIASRQSRKRHWYGGRGGFPAHGGRFSLNIGRCLVRRLPITANEQQGRE